MTDFVDRWIETLKRGAEVRQRLAREDEWKRSDERIAKAFEAYSTEELKKMWDEYASKDEAETDIDDLHRALVLRGEKDYCIY